MNIIHGSRSKIHRSYSVTDERQPNAVRRIATLAHLHTYHSFVRKHIGVTALQSGRLERTMEIDYEFVFGCFFSYTLIEIHHPLVAAFHKIYL